MYSEKIEAIIDAALADGTLTDKERTVLHNQAKAEGIDPDELDVIVEGRLAKIKKQEDWLKPSPPTNAKYGNVLKCPSCGAQVIAGNAVCPECDYTFTNIKASSAVEELQKRLDDYNLSQIDRVNRMESNGNLLGSLVGTYTDLLRKGDMTRAKAKMDIISMFPVPNARHDLLEMLTMTKMMANPTGPKSGVNYKTEENLSYGYWLLYSNCVNKAKISFSNDSAFVPYFKYYDEQIERTKGFVGFLRTMPTAFWPLISLVIFCILMYLLGFIL